MAKIKVKFLESVEVRDHNCKIEFSAKAGDKVELEAASANRWIRRGVASEDLKAKTFAENRADDTDDKPKKSNKPDPLKSAPAK